VIATMNELDEVIGVPRKLHNEERPILYSSPDFIRVISSRRRRWMGHSLARMEKLKMRTKF
jgi:hypothetical protein